MFSLFGAAVDKCALGKFDIKNVTVEKEDDAQGLILGG